VGIGGGTLTGATGLTTAQLAAALPTGFSASVWGNGDNQTTPYLLSHSAFAATSGSVILGSDVSATPTAYQVILNATQLQNINTTGLAGRYVLGSNIDASATASWNAGAGFSPIGADAQRFTGTFDGLGHGIGHLTINRPTTNFVGLFGYTDTGSVIRKVGLTAVNITGRDAVGALAGRSRVGAITNSYATGSVSGSGELVGGLVGYNNFGSVSNSYAASSVIGSSDFVGGLVGFNEGGTILSSYATGSVSGRNYVGGLVGVSAGTVSNSYATGRVTGDYVGGLVGFQVNGAITNSFWDTTTTGQVNGVGNLANGSYGATGLTTAEMRKGANFTSATTANGNVNPGWDFATTWVIYESRTAPLLRSFMTPLTVTANNAAAHKVYDGSTTYAGGTASYSVTPDSRLLGTLTYTQDSANAGSRTITPSGLWSDQQGYLISYASGSLTVDKAHLTVTAGNASKTYGDANPSLSATLSGFVNGEALATSGVSGSAAATTAATTTTGVGTATITAGAGSLSAANYDFTNLVDGTLTINQRPITVTADAKSKTYGNVDPTLTYQVTSGTLVNSDTLGAMTRAAGENVGSYTIDASALANGNYLITANNGTLSITPATLTYTPNAATFLSGQSIVGLSGTVLGFVGGDTLANSTTGTLGWTTPADSSSAPGTYRIDGGGLGAGNYVFVQASGPGTAVLTLLPSAPPPSTLPPKMVSTITQLFDSLPDSPRSTAHAQQQQALQHLQSAQQAASSGPTAFRGLGIDGTGVKLPATLNGSSP